MSYQGYTPTPTPPGTVAPTPPAYTYGAYHPSPYAHPSTPGAYSYSGAYQAGVQGYGWSYPYSYVPQPHPQVSTLQQQAVLQHIPRVPTTPVTPRTPTLPGPVPQRTTTFTAYTPSYARETTPAVHSGGRTGRRQSNLKGLFTKECQCPLPRSYCFVLKGTAVKNLMYGFGDDRNPANDTVNVMEEILIEYITDVVCFQALSFPNVQNVLHVPIANSAKLQRAHLRKLVFQSMTSAAPFLARRTRTSSPGWRSYCSCKRTSNVQGPNSRNLMSTIPRVFDGRNPLSYISRTVFSRSTHSALSAYLHGLRC